MDHDRPSDTWVSADIQAGLDGRVLSLLAFGERFDTWYRPRLGALSSLDPFDATAILTWRDETIAAAERDFGLLAPISQIVTSSVGALRVVQEPCPAYHAVREGARQRDALSSIFSRSADDALYDDLYGPLEASGSPLQHSIPDLALRHLLNAQFGRADDAFWWALAEVYQGVCGTPPPISREDFEARLPPPQKQTPRPSNRGV